MTFLSSVEYLLGAKCHVCDDVSGQILVLQVARIFLIILDVRKGILSMFEKKYLFIKILVNTKPIYMSFPRSFRDRYYDWVVGVKNVKIAVMKSHLREGK